MDLLNQQLYAYNPAQQTSDFDQYFYQKLLNCPLIKFAASITGPLDKFQTDHKYTFNSSS